MKTQFIHSPSLVFSILFGYVLNFTLRFMCVCMFTSMMFNLTKLFWAHHHYLCPQVERDFKYANWAGGGPGKVIVKLVEFDSLSCCVVENLLPLSTHLAQKTLHYTACLFSSARNKGFTCVFQIETIWHQFQVPSWHYKRHETVFMSD